jgi:hypothetical protein
MMKLKAVQDVAVAAVVKTMTKKMEALNDKQDL